MDSYGNVIVADRQNNRFVLLSPSLTNLGYIAVPGHHLKSTALVAGVTYNWTMPTGAVINSGQGTRTIVVSFNSNFIATGVMSVVKVNSCGDSPPRTLSIVKNTPATPGAITGSNFGLCNALNKIYSITAVAGLTYNWTVPAGASITSGQGSNSIHVNFPAGNFSGNIAVSGSNACGAGGIRTLAVKAIPATPAVISGNVNVCANSSGNPFSIIAIASAVNYTWTGPTGSHITGNGITSASNVLTTTAVSVTVAFGTSITTMRVKANNTCASGGTRSLTLIACPARIEPDAAKSIVYPNPSDGLFHLVFNSSANDDFTISVYDLLGKEVWNQVVKAEVGSNQQEINLNSLKAGVYLLTILSKEGKQIIKITKD